MKKLLVMVTLSAAVVAFGEDAKPVSAPASVKAVEAAKAKPLDAAKRKEMAAKHAELRAKRQAAREAAEKAAAEKEGKTLEEYRAARKAKREEMMAKRLGLTVEELQKLTPEQKRAKMTEFMRSRAAARKAIQDKKAAEKAPAAPAAK